MVELTRSRDSSAMSSCTCSPEILATLAFSNGLVLLRCPAHETQQWLVDGEPVERSVAFAGLRARFVEQRVDQRVDSSARPARRRARVIRLPEPVVHPAPVLSGRVDDESLTALLRSRGLTGTWAVA
jgi:hypothetical protein